MHCTHSIYNIVLLCTSYGIRCTAVVRTESYFRRFIRARSRHNCGLVGGELFGYIRTESRITLCLSCVSGDVLRCEVVHQEHLCVVSLNANWDNHRQRNPFFLLQKLNTVDLCLMTVYDEYSAVLYW